MSYESRLWDFLPYGAWSSRAIKLFENNALELRANVAVHYLWKNTGFSQHTCIIWVQWLRQVHPTRTIAQSKLDWEVA